MLIRTAIRIQTIPGITNNKKALPSEISVTHWTALSVLQRCAASSEADILRPDLFPDEFVQDLGGLAVALRPVADAVDVELRLEILEGVGLTGEELPSVASQSFFELRNTM